METISKKGNYISIVFTINVLLLMYLSNGMYPKLHMPGILNIILIVMSCLVSFAILKKPMLFSRRNIIITLIILLIQCITIMIYGFSPTLDIYQIGSVVCALLFTSIITFENFIKGYQKTIIFLALVSIVLYFIGSITPVFSNIPSVLLNSTNTEGTYTLLGTFVIRIKTTYTYYRNFGIFSEPGQFQLFLSIGLIIELFFRSHINWRNLVILGIAILTCNSTNGYISFILILLAYILNSNHNESKRVKKIRLFLTVSLISLLAYIFIAEDTSKLVNEYSGKIKGLFAEYSYLDSGTGLERRRAFDVALSIFLQYPIFGLGYKGMTDYIQNLSSDGFLMTFTPLNWFARFGFLYGVIANIGYLGAFCKKPVKYMSKLVLIIALFAMISSQAVNADIFMWVLIFYGLHNLTMKNFEKKQKEIFFTVDLNEI